MKRKKTATKTIQNILFYFIVILLSMCANYTHSSALSWEEQHLPWSPAIEGIDAPLQKARFLLYDYLSHSSNCLAACLWLLASTRYLQNCCPEEVFSFFTNMKRGLCVKIPSEQHFLRDSEQHRRPQHVQSRLKWTRFPFLRKSLNFNSLADASVNSLPVTWQQIKTSLPTRNKRWLAENIVEYRAVICSYILKVMD